MKASEGVKEMKEKIYEIPVNEAFEQDCECPICILEKNLEQNTMEFVLGPAMMEPDYRIQTNQKGFCPRHLRLLFQAQNKLPLALILDTHVAELNQLLGKTSLMSKSPHTEAIKKDLDHVEHSCAACDKISFVMEKYTDVIFYMWKKNPDFAQKINQSKGFCMPHFYRLLQQAPRFLSKKEAALFCEQLITLQKREMERIQTEIHWFTQKFDYKNEQQPWGTSKDAPLRTVEKLRGFLE